MKKILLAVVALVVLMGLGVVYYAYQDARGLFENDRTMVDNAITAMKNESPRSRQAYDFALERLELATTLSPWVSATEVEDLRKKLEQAKVESQSKYPAEASAWKLGECYTYVVITSQFSNKSDSFLDWYPKAKGMAWFLDVNPSLSEFEFQYQKQDPFDKQRFVRERLNAALDEVETKRGEKNRKLFRMASISVLAFLAAQQRDAFPEESASYP